jgi:hypothetical protein
MVYVRFPQLKTGINPSPKTLINNAALTPAQRMLFARNRIWGNMIGGNERSGYKELKKEFSGKARGAYYGQADLKLIYPFIQNYEKQNNLKLKYEERKTRIYMRGVKIGTKREGGAKNAMSMFE